MRKTRCKKSHPVRRSENPSPIQLRTRSAAWSDTGTFGKWPNNLNSKKYDETHYSMTWEQEQAGTPSKNEDKVLNSATNDLNRRAVERGTVTSHVAKLIVSIPTVAMAALQWIFPRYVILLKANVLCVLRALFPRAKFSKYKHTYNGYNYWIQHAEHY